VAGIREGQGAVSASTVRDLLDRLQHLRVMPDHKGDPSSLDIRNLIDGRDTTIGYARNQEFVDWFNETFEIARNLRQRLTMHHELELRIARLDLKPGDILVVKSSAALSTATYALLAGDLKRYLAPTKCMILDPSISLEVLTREHINELAGEGG
jgi:hypothetical protein